LGEQAGIELFRWRKAIWFGLGRCACFMPDVLYHGTNLISACHILWQGRLKADFPVDAEGGEPVVCMTSNRKVARMFAVEFCRHNSRLDVGAVFCLQDNFGVALPCEPFVSETASCNEFECRIPCDVPLARRLVSVQVVGRASRLSNEKWLMSLYEDENTGFSSFTAFIKAVAALREKSHK